MHIAMLLAATVLSAPVYAAAVPELVPGVWTNISPAGVNFHAGNVDPVFTQGVAVDPNDPNILYLCVCSYKAELGGLYKSTDRGASWNKIGKGPNYQGTTQLDEPIRVRINPKDSKHLYVVDGVRGNSCGFWVSRDGGENFVEPPSFIAWERSVGTPDVYDVAVDPTDFNHLLLSFHSPWRTGAAGVAESKDGGETWISRAPGDQKWYAGMSISFLDTSATWLLGTQDVGYWRTTDSGTTWTKVSDTCIQHGGGNIYRAASGSLFASGTPRNIVSGDNGLSWKPVGTANGCNAIFGDGKLLYTGQCFGPMTIQTSPESDGQTWSVVGTPQFSQGPFEFACDKHNGIVYAGCWTAGLWALRTEPAR